MTVRYLHVIPSLNPDGGGPAEGVKQLALAAARLNHEVEVASLDRPGATWLKDVCPVHCLGPGYQKYGYAPGFIPWLQRNAARFDAVVVNGLWQFHSLGTWNALRTSPTPYYVFTHGMLDPWFKRQYPLKHLKKQLYWPWAEYRVLRDARAVLFTCEEERLLARQSFRRYRANEVVLSYGIQGIGGDPAAQRDLFLTHFPQLRGKHLLLFLGRLHPKKGCDLLLEAFAASSGGDPSLHLVMAGPDQSGMQARLTDRASSLGVSHAVTFTGMLSGDVKSGAFRAADAFVLPSHQENFGIAVTEALSCGVPVLISNKVNIWREIQSDGAGLIADDTLSGTQQLLRDWLALRPGQREQMQRQSLDCFHRRYQIDGVAKNLLSLFAAQRREHARAAA
jgi:glycosyltransferase involved in cell wall biosynthesis